ncbi:NAD(P)/FAD-dependent oxidoreductase [Aneurinibacillus sp. Ricciae_BoGa-3]|uniref:NAD(P)/FAD-dependent oxidoreductase n=1 Tax=Aneurinibacillus sp. Ricciae_BoGa-3 TaxID=3022697 RepID=UPI0023405CB5|nr:NAD(P)/FAD-dependent oxidoreductase [Aneurinibacillus sp. Ricciae_BoGa-3]WCK56049.1 NAD(P)/FAD-dependent oxidoreductase [Aneurinibacillus sp. Ricciae_BoGa-3]
MYDCVIIGGGIAGLQAALQLGRYMHRIAVIDRHRGRSLLARNYRNILGWPDGVSGPRLRELGTVQARAVGVEFMEDTVVDGSKNGEGFHLKLGGGETIQARRVLISTGLTDRIPDGIEGMKEVLGLSMYVCPDCDGYEIKDRVTVVIGAGNPGASLACELRYWTKRVTFINHEPEESPVSAKLQTKCQEKGISIIDGPAARIHYASIDMLTHVELRNSKTIPAEKGFIAFGGNKAESDIAKKLGVERLENGHIPVDGRTKQTNVPNIWAAGDVVAHSQLLTVAIGDGAQAAIWIHKSLIQ